jgi:hypothetical protein
MNPSKLSSLVAVCVLGSLIEGKAPVRFVGA